MSDSHDHDHEWLLARERGGNVDHIPEATRRKYARLEALIAALPGESPSVGWQQRVLDSLEPAAKKPTVEPPAARRRWRWIGSAGLAAAALLVIVVITRPRSLGTVEPTLVTEVQAGDAPHRGGNVSIGDKLIVKAESSAQAELRVYGDSGEPLARCGAAGAVNCSFERAGDLWRFRIELVLRTRGVVRSVLFIGSSIATPGATLDDDLFAASRDKTTTLSAAPVVVQ